MEENLRAREVLAEGTVQFITSQIEEFKRQIIEQETRLERLRAGNGGRRVSQADILPYEVLQETYKAFLIKSQESQIAANLERRRSGVQFKVIDPARLPERPVGPSRLSVSVIGGFAGLGLGLVFVGVSAARRPRHDGQPASEV